MTFGKVPFSGRYPPSGRYPFGKVPFPHDLRGGTLCAGSDPFRLGRYVALEHVGAGGMGVVYAAYDTHLDRRVALKVLRRSWGSAADEGLLREARALARVTHPNVVAVHEVGQDKGLVYMAMEYVDGPTLRQAMAGTPSLLAARELLQQLLRGVGAIHRAGLVHGDLKPDNVMIARDDGGDVVKILDFGLSARLQAEPSPAREGPQPGTPGYRAPELAKGHPPDVRSDVYAASATVAEILLGRVPRSAADLGARTRWGRALPAPLRRALLQGLAGEPPARSSSVEPLARALAGSSRRRPALVAVGVVALAGAGLFASRTELPPDPCARVASWADEAWPASRRAQALSHLGAGAAELVAQADEWVKRWTGQRMELCRAPAVGEVIRTAQELCMHRALQAAEPRLTALAEPPPLAPDKARAMLAGLPDLERCDDLVALQLRTPLPESPDLRARIDQAFAAVEHANAQKIRGDFVGAAREVQEIRPEVEALDHPPLSARFGVVAGVILLLRGDEETARSDFERAYTQALAGGDDEAALDAAIELVHLAGAAGDLAAAEAWALAARGIHRRMEGPAERLATLELALGITYNESGRPAQGLATLDRAAEIFADLPNPHPTMATTVNINRAESLLGLGRADEAARLADATIAAQDAALGADHPYTAGFLAVAARAHRAAGHRDEALARIARSLELDASPPGSPRRLKWRLWRAELLLELGRRDEARDELVALRAAGPLAEEERPRARALAERLGLGGAAADDEAPGSAAAPRPGPG
ncbi:MAG: serine/threonine protein kinase [Deltaproteobacteria bacterium]|nr:MAG: serine/threonine protein kinase [Deltaproteobacteria bacterium]